MRFVSFNTMQRSLLSAARPLADRSLTHLHGAGSVYALHRSFASSSIQAVSTKEAPAAIGPYRSTQHCGSAHCSPSPAPSSCARHSLGSAVASLPQPSDQGERIRLRQWISRPRPQGECRNPCTDANAHPTAATQLTAASPPSVPLQTGEFPSKDVVVQTKQSLDNMAAILSAGNSSMAQVVKTTILLADIKDFPKVNEVYASCQCTHSHL